MENLHLGWSGLSQPARGHLAMLAFSALVAGSFSLGVLAAPHVDPGALSVLRFILAGVLVGAAARATTGFPKAAFAAPWRYLVLGGLLASYFVLMFEGLKTAPPVSAAAVFTLTPVMAAGFGWLTLRQRLTGRMALALAIGGLGALWVIFRADLAALLAFHVGRGEAIYFLGCVGRCRGWRFVLFASLHLPRFVSLSRTSRFLANGLRELNLLPIQQQSSTALLHKSASDRSSPFPGQTYPASSVIGVPSAVKRFRTATRTWNSAT